MKIFVGAGDRRETDPDKLRVPVPEYLEVVAEDFLGFIKRFSCNISRGGAFIATDRPLVVGQSLAILFRLSDDYTLIRGHGTIIWVRTAQESPGREPGMGVRFDWLDDASQQLINKIVSNFIREGGKPFKLEDGPLGRTGSMTAIEMAAINPPPGEAPRPPPAAREPASAVEPPAAQPSGAPSPLRDLGAEAANTGGWVEGKAERGQFDHLQSRAPSTSGLQPVAGAPAPHAPQQPAAAANEFSLLPELLENEAANEVRAARASGDKGDPFALPDGLSLDLEAPNPFVDMSAGDQVDDHLEYSLELGGPGASGEHRRLPAGPKPTLGDRDPLEALLRSGPIVRPVKPPGDFPTLEPPESSSAAPQPPTGRSGTIAPPASGSADTPTTRHDWNALDQAREQSATPPQWSALDPRRTTPPLAAAPESRRLAPPPPAPAEAPRLTTRPITRPVARPDPPPAPFRSSPPPERFDDDEPDEADYPVQGRRSVITMLGSALLSIVLGAGLFVAGQRLIDRLRAGPEVVAVPLDDREQLQAEPARTVLQMVQDGIAVPAVTARSVDGAVILSMIENVSYYSDQDRTIVTLWANGAFTPSTTSYRRLDGELPRDLIKVLGVENAYQPANIAIGSNHLSRLRIGFEKGRQFDELWVVADLPRASVGLVQMDLDYGRLHLTFARRSSN